jgi:hypothetical protein
MIMESCKTLLQTLRFPRETQTGRNVVPFIPFIPPKPFPWRSSAVHSVWTRRIVEESQNFIDRGICCLREANGIFMEALEKSFTGEQEKIG